MTTTNSFFYTPGSLLTVVDVTTPLSDNIINEPEETEPEETELEVAEAEVTEPEETELEVAELKENDIIDPLDYLVFEDYTEKSIRIDMSSYVGIHNEKVIKETEPILISNTTQQIKKKKRLKSQKKIARKREL